MQSRYYDPIIKRFLNADAFASTGQGFLGYNMFAYCGNNSPLGKDHTGNYAVFQEDLVLPEEEAYYYEPVNGQGREPIASIGFGTSNMGDSGCAVIAVHDGLLASGYHSDLRQWIAYFTSKKIFRVLGVLPCEIDNALDHAGVSYIESSDPSIVEKLKYGGAAIVTYWNNTTLVSEPATYYRGPVYGYFPDISKGAHTIAITYHNNSYWVYNSWNYAEKVEPYNTLSFCTQKGAFIYGYYIYPNS